MNGNMKNPGKSVDIDVEVSKIKYHIVQSRGPIINVMEFNYQTMQLDVR